MTVIVIRDVINRNQCLGICIVRNAENKIVFTSQSLERGWLNNVRNISCIPAGKYDLRLEWSPKFRTHLWEIYNVPNRRECKFHAANFVRELNGCIALGSNRVLLDRDGLIDVANSGKTMRRFHHALNGLHISRLHVINSVV